MCDLYWCVAASSLVLRASVRSIDVTYRTSLFRLDRPCVWTVRVDRACGPCVSIMRGRRGPLALVRCLLRHPILVLPTHERSARIRILSPPLPLPLHHERRPAHEKDEPSGRFRLQTTKVEGVATHPHARVGHWDVRCHRDCVCSHWGGPLSGE